MKNLLPLTLLAALVVSSSVGCKKKDDVASAPAGSSSAVAVTPAKSAPVTGQLVSMTSAKVQFDAPGGWTRYENSGWTRFKPADDLARLAFVTFDKPNESTRRLGQISEQFDLTGLTWGEATTGTVGRDAFPARIGESKSCTLKAGDPCYMWYATVNPGGAEQVLIVYLVNTKTGEAERSHAVAAVKSLRRL